MHVGGGPKKASQKNFPLSEADGKSSSSLYSVSNAEKMALSSTKSWSRSLSLSSIKGDDIRGVKNLKAAPWSLRGGFVGSTTATFSFSKVRQSEAFVWQSNWTTYWIDSSMKITVVASGPEPSKPTTLFLGRARVPTRFVILWYIQSLVDVGNFASTMDSILDINDLRILAPKLAGLAGSTVELSAKAETFLLAVSLLG